MRADADLVSAKQEMWKSINGVDVFRFELDCDAKRVEEYRTLLNAQELQRADRYFTEQLRTHFIVGRATTRIILARYLSDTGPAKVEFHYGSHEKPFLPASDWRFNLAHSHGLALLAVSNNGDVGVDLEQIDERVEIDEIAERFFTPEECAEMMSRTGEARAMRFFDLWCCKEAYLKAEGVGISGGLNKCRIVDAPDGTASVHNPDDAEAALRWRIHRLDPGVGYAGALCTRIE
jgi:4'-phosphopantetheinyl transferase